MHKTRKLAALLLILALAMSLAACGSGSEPTAPPAESAAADTESPAPAAEDTESPAPADEDIWAEAEYTEDTELGEGAKTIAVECTADEKTVTFTIHTDAESLGAALQEIGLLEGEESQYGLFVKAVNGMGADYDTDGYYWALYIDGQYASTGVDTTPVTDGGSYALVREAA